MKTFVLFIGFVLFLSVGYAQTNCEPYVPVDKGSVWEITNYSAKGKPTGRIVHELVNKVENANEITFTIKTITYDTKDEEIYTNTFDAKCSNGKFEFDMAVKMDGGALKAYENMEVTVDASKFEIPSFNSPSGSSLEDGSLMVKVGTGAIAMFKMTVLVTERIVEGKEELVTPAGSFKCIIISQKVSTKMMIRVRGSSKEWYAENTGLVRSESYNKKGKLMGYSELTKITLN